jgi:hypothetical protein
MYHVYCRVARGEFVFDNDFEAIEFRETLCTGARSDVLDDLVIP